MTLRNKKILITGSAGTVGSELIAEILREYGESTNIIGIDRNENAVFNQKLEFNHLENVKIYVCDINDKETLRTHINNADIMVHCAAMKHVMLAEETPNEAIFNNIGGVQTLIELAHSAKNLEKVLFTSSDKAVNPTNVMGTTKLLGERLFSIANYQSKSTIFTSTRFGNVIGSNGSVLEIFKTQILNNKPITLTDLRMTRFIMSKKQAARLVLNTLSLMTGGEVFITKMPVIKISDLAQSLIQLYTERSLINCDADYPMKTIGAKPGEKMYEELMTEEEMIRAYETRDYFVVTPIHPVKSRTASISGRVINEKLTKVYNSKNEASLGIPEIKKYLVDQKLI